MKIWSISLEYIICGIMTDLQYIPIFNKDFNIPINVTHLTVCFDFYESIKNYIPNSVTHLTFTKSISQNIKECIP